MLATLSVSVIVVGTVTVKTVLKPISPLVFTSPKVTVLSLRFSSSFIAFCSSVSILSFLLFTEFISTTSYFRGDVATLPKFLSSILVIEKSVPK